MTLRWLEGGESNGHTTFLERKYRTTTGTPVLGLNQGRSGQLGDHCLRNTAAILYTPSLSSASPETDTWIVGFGIKVDDNTGAGSPADSEFCGIEFITNTDVSPADQLSLQLVRVDTFIYKWSLRRGNALSDPEIASSSPFWANKWYHFELKVKLDPTTGTYELRQDGVDIMSGSGANTAASGDAGADSIGIHMEANFAGVPFQLIDDLFVLDSTGTYNNDFLGDCYIEGILPNDDGDLTQWTPSAAVDHYTLVDEETSVDDATKVTSETVDQVELFEYEPLSRIVDNIRGVVVYSCHAMQSSGSRDFKITMRDSSNNDNLGTTEYTSDDVVYVTETDIVEKEPQGGSEWTKADIDSYQFGVKVTG